MIDSEISEIPNTPNYPKFQKSKLRSFSRVAHVPKICEFLGSRLHGVVGGQKGQPLTAVNFA